MRGVQCVFIDATTLSRPLPIVAHDFLIDFLLEIDEIGGVRVNNTAIMVVVVIAGIVVIEAFRFGL